MMKKILLITVLSLFIFQGIASAGFKVWVKPDFSHQIPFNVDKGEVIKGVITVRNENDFTIKGEAESNVVWATVVPKDFSILPSGEKKFDYTINTPNRDGAIEGTFKIIEWVEESAGGEGMTGRYSHVIPFTLKVQGAPGVTTQPIKSEPKYLLPTNFILVVILIIIACVVVLILWLSQRKTV